MEISDAIYEEITGLSELPPPVDEADYERRKHRRVPFGHRAIILPERKGFDNAPAVVMVRDISMSGVSFLHDEALKVGTPMQIEFKGHEERPVKVHGTVVRCEAGGSGGTQFVVATAFDAVLTEELPPEKLNAKAKPVPLAPAEPIDDKPIPAEPAILEAKPAETKHVEPQPAAPAVETAAKSSALFRAADPNAVKDASDEYWAMAEVSETSPAQAAPKPPPEAAEPTFRVVPMPEPEKEAAVTLELGPQTSVGGGKSHEVLARVKELLVKQERTIEAQRRELDEQRGQFEKEIAAARLELEDAKKNLAELRAKSEADDNAIADLADFVREHAGSESPDQRNEAA